MNTPEQSQLGKPSPYVDQYDASLLFPIPRADKRAELGITGMPPFFGADMWTVFELSWLNLRGKPQVALAHITVPCESPKKGGVPVMPISARLSARGIGNKSDASY